MSILGKINQMLLWNLRVEPIENNFPEFSLMKLKILIWVWWICVGFVGEGIAAFSVVAWWSWLWLFGSYSHYLKLLKNFKRLTNKILTQKHKIAHNLKILKENFLNFLAKGFHLTRIQNPLQSVQKEQEDHENFFPLQHGNYRKTNLEREQKTMKKPQTNKIKICAHTTTKIASSV